MIQITDSTEVRFISLAAIKTVEYCTNESGSEITLWGFDGKAIASVFDEQADRLLAFFKDQASVSV